MKKILLTTVGIAVLAATPLANAANFQVPISKTITDIRVYDYGITVTFTPAEAANIGGCTGVNAKKSVQLNWDQTNAKLFYAALLAAYTAGTTVGFGATDNCVSGFGGPLSRIYRVDSK